VLTWQCQLIFHLFNSLQNFYLSFLLGVDTYLILVAYYFFKKFPLFLEVKNSVNVLFIFIKIVITSTHHQKKKLTEFLLYQHHLKKGVKVRKNLLDEVVGMVPRQPTPNLMEVVSEDLSLHNRPL
jgi:hypothetical protein